MSVCVYVCGCGCLCGRFCVFGCVFETRGQVWPVFIGTNVYKTWYFSSGSRKPYSPPKLFFLKMNNLTTMKQSEIYNRGRCVISYFFFQKYTIRHSLLGCSRCANSLNSNKRFIKILIFFYKVKKFLTRRLVVSNSESL